MQIEVEKIHRRKDIENELDDLRRRHGSIENLQQAISADRCSNPLAVDDYFLWKALDNPECEYVERITIDSPNIFNDLTPKRLELLEYVRGNDVDSIKKLAEVLRRDYKNVYDDIKALEKWGLVSLSRRGKDKRPVSHVQSLRVTLK